MSDCAFLVIIVFTWNLLLALSCVMFQSDHVVLSRIYMNSFTRGHKGVTCALTKYSTDLIRPRLAAQHWFNYQAHVSSQTCFKCVKIFRIQLYVIVTKLLNNSTLLTSSRPGRWLGIGLYSRSPAGVNRSALEILALPPLASILCSGPGIAWIEVRLGGLSAQPTAMRL